MREIIEKPHSGKMKDKHEDKQKKRKINIKISGKEKYQQK